MTPGTVTAELAGVYDGRALWLAVPLEDLDGGDGGDGGESGGWSVAVRSGDELIDLGGDTDRGWLVTVADLPTTPGEYDVLVTRGDLARRVVVPDPGDRPTKSVVVDGRRTRLRNDPDGARVIVATVKPTADVLALGTDGDTIWFTVPGEAGELVFIQDQEDRGSMEMTAGPDGLTVHLRAEDVPGSNVRLEVDHGGLRRQVRRHHNELTSPSSGVLLPRLEDDGGNPTLVCLWHPMPANLRLRRPDLADAGEAEE